MFIVSKQNLYYGTFGVYNQIFMPEKKFMLVGYSVQAYVCLDCGMVGSYLKNSDIQDLQKSMAKKKNN